MKQIFRIGYPIAIYMGITFTAGILGMIGISFVLILQNISPQMGMDGNVIFETTEIYNRNVLLITCLSALITIPIFHYFFKWDQMKRGIFPVYQRKLPQNMRYLIVLAISACIAGNNLIIVSGIHEIFNGYQEISGNLYQNSIWLQILGVGVVIPIAEEFTFRALGFRRLRDNMGFIKAAVISALCFAVFHGNVVQGIYAFILGILMAYVYEAYGSFMAPVLFHCVANLTSVLISITVVGRLMYGNIIVMVSVTIITSMLVGVSLLMIHKHVKAEENMIVKEEAML